MEPNNPTPAEAPMLPHEEKGAVGPTIALIVIVLVLLVGGLYFWSQNAKEEIPSNTIQQETTDNSNDLSEIEADLDANVVDSENDLNSIDTAFDGQAAAQ